MDTEGYPKNMMCSTLSHDKIYVKTTSVIPGLYAVISGFIVAILDKKGQFSSKSAKLATNFDCNE